MRGPAKHENRWLQILIAVVVLAAVVFGVYHMVGSRAGKQDLDRSVDTITSTLGKALTLREKERSGQASVTQVRAELENVRKDLEDVAKATGHSRPEPSLVQHYQRVSHFSANAAKQVHALASDAPPDSLDRTEARLRAMLAASSKLRAAAASDRRNPR
jgi:flagellar basal body-associated protein FliL